MRLMNPLAAWLLLALVVCGCGGGATKEASAPPPDDRATDTSADSSDLTGSEDASSEPSLRDDEVAAMDVPEEEAAPDIPYSVALPAEAAPETAAPDIAASVPREAARDESRMPRISAAPGSRSDADAETGDAASDAGADQPGYKLEKIYYGTDRAPQITAAERSAAYRDAFRLCLIFAGIGLTLLLFAVLASKPRVIAITLAVVSLLGSAWFLRSALLERQQAELDDQNENRRYGHTIHVVDGKHMLERGICWVSVPTDVHVRGSGELEAPGLFEVSVDPEEHFQLQRVQVTE